MRKKKKFRNLAGTVLPMAVLFLTAIIPIAGLGVDFGYFSILRGSLEKATEAASVSGAQEYFRSRADAGKAINEALRVFKLNISNDRVTTNYHQPTGRGNLSSYTYSITFSSSDNINSLFRQSPISVTIMTDMNRGKVSVSSEVVAEPFFAHFLRNQARIRVSREAELPPYDVAFVVDLSGSMRFATLNTYIGNAYRQMVGLPGLGMLFPDIVLTQSQGQTVGYNSMITANGYVTTVVSVTDVVINTPGTDIPTNATYTTGKPIYIPNPDRGYIVNTDRSTGLRRTALTGYRISELQGLNISTEDKQLAQTYSDNSLAMNIIGSSFDGYFNRAKNYIEPYASAVYGVMSFIDTVKVYGAAALKIGLVTFESNSYLSDRTSSWTCPELRTSGIARRMNRELPYLALVDPIDFNRIITKLTILTMGGNGTLVSPIRVNSYPNGGTNINAGLDNAKATLDRSDRPNSERIIILFTDGAPSHSFSALGSKVRSLTDAGIRVYSIVLTLAVPQATIDQFRYQMEVAGRAEPVIFISDPARLKEAFLQIADELGLKLVN